MTPRAGYSAEQDLPPQVRRAVALAARLGFENSCAPAYGRLLRVLAARGGLIGEAGTGCGVGSAWMLDGMPSDSKLITFEADAERAAAVQDLFRDEPRVTVVRGDSRELFALGPFDLVFADGGGKEPDWSVPVVSALRKPGGVLFFDDMMWGRPPAEDRVKSFWLGHPELVATEVMAAAPDWSAIIATRRGT